MVARVVAAFQLEDPQRFSSEFQRSIETFCSLEAAEFKVLLPCLQELQDWHYTKAFAKVLEVAKWGLEHGSEPEGPEVWRQCSMMLAEVALDAAVYLPDVFIPEPDEETSDQAAVSGSSAPEFDLACSILSGVRLPRPVPVTAKLTGSQAADANHQGAQRLCQWSQRLWRAGHGSARGRCVPSDEGVERKHRPRRFATAQPGPLSLPPNCWWPLWTRPRAVCFCGMQKNWDAKSSQKPGIW
eukprot:s2728_g5.t1